VLPLTKPSRRRNKAHLAFVASQLCLVCQSSPCDAHHLKFAQPQALGRKVSDEFTVPFAVNIIVNCISMAMKPLGGQTCKSLPSTPRKNSGELTMFMTLTMGRPIGHDSINWKRFPRAIKTKIYQ
jgi:hypothetical protein